MHMMTCWNNLQRSSFLLSFSLDARHSFTMLCIVTWQQYILNLTTQHSQFCVLYALKLLFRRCSFRALAGALLSYISRKQSFSRMEQPFNAKHLPFMISMPLWWRTMIRGNSDALKLKWVTVDRRYIVLRSFAAKNGIQKQFLPQRSRI